MTHRKLLAVFIAVIACVSVNVDAQQLGPDREATQWIQRALTEIQALKVGMNRGQLLLVLTTEGGLSTRSQRTYVYPRCPYIKVDIQFQTVGDPKRDPEGRVSPIESAEDIITQISRPYLAWSVTD
jgi:hypothetical protein